MPPLTVWFALAGVLVTLVLLARAVRFTPDVKPTTISYHDLHAVAVESHERIGEYLRAHHGGDPAMLDRPLRGLIPVVREIAARHAVTLDDALLRTVIVTSVASHHLATRAQAEAAFDAARIPERGAA